LILLAEIAGSDFSRHRLRFRRQNARFAMAKLTPPQQMEVGGAAAAVGLMRAPLPVAST
jgi:hypothetical protein